jgi:hypothetical protein
MPFLLSGRQHLGGGLWFYRTTDDAAAVNAANYWGPSWPLMRVGDQVLRTTFDGAGAVVSTGTHVVTSATRTAATTSGGV